MSDSDEQFPDGNIHWCRAQLRLEMVIQFAHLFLGKIPDQQIFCHAKMSFLWKPFAEFQFYKWLVVVVGVDLTAADGT